MHEEHTPFRKRGRCRGAFRGPILTLAASLSLTPADAALWCSGKVATIYTSVSGNLTIDWGYQPILVCNMNEDTTYSPPNGFVGYKTCNGIMTEALTAQATGRDFQALLPNDSSCNGLFTGGGPPAKFIIAYRVDQ